MGTLFATDGVRGAASLELSALSADWVVMSDENGVRTSQTIALAVKATHG